MAKQKDKFIDFGTGDEQVSSRDIPADFTPSNYTPSQVGSEGDDKTSAHLNGIDTALDSAGLLTQYSLSVSGSNYSTIRAVGVPYKTTDGAWRMKFNIAGSLSGTNLSLLLNITGVVFKNVGSYAQAVNAWFTTGAIDATIYASCNPNTNEIEMRAQSTQSYQRIMVSGDVELNAKPAFVA